jgi:signal transduction histidine kinase
MMLRGFKYVYSDAAKARLHLDSALALSKQKGFLKGQYKVINIYGILKDVAGQHDSAIIYYMLAGKMALLQRDTLSYAQINNNIGLIYWNREKPDSALMLFRESENCFRRLGYTLGLANTLNNIGLILSDANRQKEAIKVYREVLVLREQLKDTFGIGAALHNLGYTWFGLNSDSATNYYYRALPFERAANDFSGLSKTFNDLATLTGKQSEQENFTSLLDSAIFYKKKTDDVFGLASTYHNAGEYYLREARQPKTALYYFAQADSILLHHSFPKIAHKIWFSMGSAYGELQDFRKAYTYMQQSIRALESARNEASEKRIEQLSIQYETERKQREIDRLESKRAILELKDRQKSLLMGIAGTLAVFTLLLSLSAFRRYRQKKNLELKEQLIAERERSLYAVIQSAESERARIARELHDGAVQEVAAIKLQWQSKALQNKHEEFSVQSLDNLADNLRQISHRVMPRELKNGGLKTALQSLFSNEQGRSKILTRFECSDLPLDISSEIELTIYRVCQELLQNSLKHSEATTIDIQLYGTDKNIILLFEDDGKGIADGHHNTGLGLTNLRARVLSLSGSIDFSNSPAGGLLVTVRIPF